MAKELKKVPTLGGDLCDLPAVFHVYGTVRRGGGWSAINIKVKNEGSQLEVASYTLTNPDTRPLAQEQFKITVGKAWGAGE
jgi:hypothetical protein